jgi:hypothetical protein
MIKGLITLIFILIINMLVPIQGVQYMQGMLT